jgi:hypothetical protein
MSMPPTTKIISYAALFLVFSLFFGGYSTPALAQEGAATVQDLVVNGGFEGGFQPEFGIGYGWGAFSNGNAVVAWQQEDTTVDGQFAQRMEIKDALENDRYVGVYQTVSVVPGQQYKLSLKGRIQSDEGQVSASDYGYRLQYAVDYDGDTAWELVDSGAWQELPWDEFPLDANNPLATFDTTLTAQTDEFTLFVRGRKKWTNNGTGVFILDDIQIVGQAPAGFQSPVSQTETTAVEAEPPTPAAVTEAAAAMDTPPAEQVPLTPQETITTLPVTGYGDDQGIFFLILLAVTLLVILFGGAFAATFRWRNL